VPSAGCVLGSRCGVLRAARETHRNLRRAPRTPNPEPHPAVAGVGRLDPSSGAEAVITKSPVTRVSSASELISDEHARVRFITRVMSVLALVSLAVSMMGVYGAFWCAVNQRRHEIGVRLAIGAAPGDVVRMIVGESLRVALSALAAGLPLALAASFAVRPLLFEVSSTDPTTMSAVVGVLILCAMAAAYIPARDASRIDPVETLRAQ
jgi:putative ABC transport system permease protein